MAGQPRAREKLESDLLLGKTTATERAEALAKYAERRDQLSKAKRDGAKNGQAASIESTEAPELPPLPEPVKTGKGNRRGQSPEYMRALARRRMEMAKTDPSKRGGRPRTKFSKEEIEQRAIEKMTPKALKLLKEQLEDASLTPRERREVAKLVLEYKLGKPTQKVEQKVDQRISAIRFETAAFMGIPDVDLELEAGDVSEDEAE